MSSRRVPGQSGFTLVEVLIAISLAGILTAALSTGILFLFRANATLTEEQQLQRVLGNFAESIRSLDYIACNDPALGSGNKQDLAKAAYVEDLVDTQILESSTNLLGDPVLKPKADWRPAEGVTVDIVEVRFWRAKPASGVTAKSYNAACPADTDNGSQLLTIEARLGDKSATTQVVKAVRADGGAGGSS